MNLRSRGMSLKVKQYDEAGSEIQKQVRVTGVGPHSIHDTVSVDDRKLAKTERRSEQVQKKVKKFQRLRFEMNIMKRNYA